MEKAVLTEDRLARIETWNASFLHVLKARTASCGMIAAFVVWALQRRAITMQYTDNEAALIGGLISNYFFQPSVDAKLRESYRRVLRHLHEDTLSASDLSRIQNALTFLSPLCRDTREAHKDMMGVTLKTDALLRASR